LSVILNGKMKVVCNPKGTIDFRVHFLCRKQCHFARFCRYCICHQTAPCLKRIVNHNLFFTGSGVLLRFLVHLNPADEQ
jgi:hypothetical protein